MGGIDTNYNRVCGVMIYPLIVLITIKWTNKDLYRMKC